MEDFEEALRQKGLVEEEIGQIILGSQEADPAITFLKLMASIKYNSNEVFINFT